MPIDEYKREWWERYERLVKRLADAIGEPAIKHFGLDIIERAAEELERQDILLAAINEETNAHDWEAFRRTEKRIASERSRGGKKGDDRPCPHVDKSGK